MVAMLGVSTDDLGTRYGLEFFDGVDNLDAYTAAVIRLGSGRRVGLLRHSGNPVAGTELHVDSEDDYLGAIREFLDAFELTTDALTWVRDEVPIDHLRLAEDAANA
ncbi:MAG: hypothetical protein ACJ8J0_11655 [Longimicrobiaceae bacterium]